MNNQKLKEFWTTCGCVYLTTHPKTGILLASWWNMKPLSKVQPIFPYLNDSGSVVFSPTCRGARRRCAKDGICPLAKQARQESSRHDERTRHPDGQVQHPSWRMRRTSGAESWLVGVGPVSLPAEYATQKRWMNRCPALAR